jgi:hypothetical protein
MEEAERLSSYLKPVIHTCPKKGCCNNSVPLGTKRAYRSYGKNQSGSPRFRCNECGSTFCIPLPTKGQHETHFNRDIFSLLVNKVPLARIIELNNYRLMPVGSCSLR